MGAEKESAPAKHSLDDTHVVQATDKMGRTVSRDGVKSRAEAETRAAELEAEGHSVEISALEPKAADRP